ncbi:(d)CMP kinase [Spirochaeta cellobiosiphila]|uniref:(d)CMP kinase n=1 Tax=Spirochaeta cellobiosiphila TaxID=504483 RepID=UPI000425B854|nr:(d)CMP kinase [Spirochaeta cellobiosiphila]
MVIAMDGPAGVGKSTICNKIAKLNNIFYLNSGSLYRGITYFFLSNKIDWKAVTDIYSYLQDNVVLDFIEHNLHLNGSNIEDLIRTDEVDSHVAQISSIVPIRTFVNERIREISHSMSIIIEGRDMTTEVFPDAELKFYLDASIKKRALRRYNQGISGLSLSEIEDNIALRDKIDKNKKVGSLKIAEGAIYLDTSDLTIDEVCAKVTSHIKELLS